MKAARNIDEVENYGCCPRCNGDTGYYQSIATVHDAYYTWEPDKMGNVCDDSSELCEISASVMRCCDCKKPIYPFNT